MKLKDPYQQREADKYENPIPSRELILQVLNESAQPLDFDHIIKTLNLMGEQEQEALRKRLRAMERDGQVLFNRRRHYVPISRADLIAGRVQGHPDGFGFLIPEDGSEDLFLHSKQMRSLMHGDRILASVRSIDHKGRREGNLVEVLERGNDQVVGRFLMESGISFVVPDNTRIQHDIMIPAEYTREAQHGQIVVVSIIEQPTKRSRPIGKVLSILGDHMAPGMEIDIAIRSHELPFEWPLAVREAADQLGHEILEADKTNRLDLRNTPLVTIDGEDARDFDDAVYCEYQEGRWRLLVAIADVSHYVTPESALDREAALRGTSVYFPGEVIPMLPEVLSNGLCSLNPQVDRLCMVCEMFIDEKGGLLSYRFHEAVMHSHARLTYTEVAAMLVDEDETVRQRYEHLLEPLDRLYGLYQALAQARRKRGAIDFEATETQIVFDQERKIQHILPRVRNDAHRIIEECMILANVCAARFLKKHKIPSLYRFHDQPNPNKLEDLRTFLNSVGLSLGGGLEPETADYARVLEHIQGRPDFHLIQMVLLRSLSQAHYTPDHQGHFGLSLQDYAHFTSPIRRYPDLLVHRAIRHILQKHTPEQFTYSLKDMQALGEHCSMAERRADEATRDVEAWLECEYMQDRVGENFTGVISAVTGFGVFVELEKIYVEGLVHISALTNDYYHFDPVRHRLTGESSGRVFRLGDPIEITVARVDLDERKIDFVLAERFTDSKRPRKKGSKSRR